MALLIFSKSVKISWGLTCVLSFSSVAICTCIFLRCFAFNISHRGEVEKNSARFPDALLYCLTFDTIFSFFHLWITFYFYSCISRYKFQVFIPAWVIINVGFFYCSLAAIVFPVLTTSSLASNFDSNSVIDDNSTLISSNISYLSASTIKPHQSQHHFPTWLTSINGFPLPVGIILTYYGVFVSKTLAFASLALSLFEYNCKLKEMHTVLDNLNVKLNKN